MSYEKAMKHNRNVVKCRKQSRNYFGFNTASGRWPSGYGNPNLRPLLDIRNWFPIRNNGDGAYKKHLRECIREAIEDARIFKGK